MQDEYCLVHPINEENLNNIKPGDILFSRDFSGNKALFIVSYITDTPRGKCFMLGNSQYLHLGWAFKLYGVCKQLNIIEVKKGATCYFNGFNFVDVNTKETLKYT